MMLKNKTHYNVDCVEGLFASSWAVHSVACYSKVSSLVHAFNTERYILVNVIQDHVFNSTSGVKTKNKQKIVSYFIKLICGEYYYSMYPGSCQDKLVAELFRIIHFGDVDSCLKFIEKNFPSAENWCRLRHGKSGDTVPIIAAAHGCVSLLALCSDADLESSNKDGKRPLHAACQSSHVNCVRYLLSRCASVDCLRRGDWYI